MIMDNTDRFLLLAKIAPSTVNCNHLLVSRMNKLSRRVLVLSLRQFSGKDVCESIEVAFVSKRHLVSLVILMHGWSENCVPNVSGLVYNEEPLVPRHSELVVLSRVIEIFGSERLHRYSRRKLWPGPKVVCIDIYMSSCNKLKPLHES
jgi:hypothetical protein